MKKLFVAAALAAAFAANVAMAEEVKEIKLKDGFIIHVNADSSVKMIDKDGKEVEVKDGDFDLEDGSTKITIKDGKHVVVAN
ncbi:MAG: hypothetical protein J0H68_08060 [Sphingobacteriia bacterium]|nr:hypothetical protein [Sphingobacteriia bacterium]